MPVLQGLDRRTVDELAERVADEAPLLVVGSALEGDAEHLGAEAGEPDGEERAEDHGVLGLGLDADPVRPLHVAAHDRPHDAGDEDGAGRVADERVGLVGAAVEELEVLGELVVDLEHGRDAEQDQEPEVDHRVHRAGGRIAQQRAHVDAGAEVAEAALGVLHGRPPCRGRSATFPVLHAVGEPERPPGQQHRDQRVEHHLQRTGDVDEHDAVDVVLVVPVGDLGDDPGGDGEHGDADPERDRQLVRPEASRFGDADGFAGVGAGRCRVRAHRGRDAS